jgi:hypothetical protein
MDTATTNDTITQSIREIDGQMMNLVKNNSLGCYCPRDFILDPHVVDLGNPVGFRRDFYDRANKRGAREQPFLLPAELLPEEQFSTNESPVLLNSQDSIKHT